MPMSDAVSSEGPKTTAFNKCLWPCPLRKDISPVSLNLLMMLCTVDLQSICNLTLRNVFLLLPRIDGIAHLTSFLFLRSVRKTLKILCRFFVTQISVIPHSKLLGVYF